MEQIFANGLYLGAQYALIALGLTLIFSLMNVLNFAHGQMYVFGGFVTYTVVAQLGLPFIVGLVASAVVLAVMGAAIEKFLFRPVIRRSRREESTMLLAAGIAFFLDAVILLLFGEKQRGVPKIVNGVFNWDMRIIMPYDRILIAVLAVALIAGFILVMSELGIKGPQVAWPIFALALYAGLTMVTNVPFYSFKDLSMKKSVPFPVIVLVALAIGGVSIDPAKALLGVFGAYGISGYVVYVWRRYKGEQTSVISTSTDEPDERGLH